MKCDSDCSLRMRSGLTRADDGDVLNLIGIHHLVFIPVLFLVDPCSFLSVLVLLFLLLPLRTLSFLAIPFAASANDFLPFWFLGLLVAPVGSN